MNVRLWGQGQPLWCWASTAQGLAFSSGASWRQGEVADHTLTRNDCTVRPRDCNQPCTLENALGTVGLTPLRHPRQLFVSCMCGHLNRGELLTLFIRYSGSQVGHFAILSGVRLGAFGPEVRVHDPADGAPFHGNPGPYPHVRVQWLNFGLLSSGYRTGRWSQTYEVAV